MASASVERMPTSQPPNKASKRKPNNDDANDSMLKKACSIMVQEDDEYDVFGCFVASELRCLKQDFNRRRLKRIIQRAILDVAEEDEMIRPTVTDTSNSERSSVCTPMQGIAPIEQGFVGAAASGNSTSRCMLTYDFPEQNSEITW